MKMSDNKQEIKILKNLVKAQDKMLLHYRLGKPSLPEWVFAALDKAMDFYGVIDISKIK